MIAAAAVSVAVPLLVFAPGAVARRDFRVVPASGGEAQLCTADEGDFYGVPWRVPSDVFGGYYCIWYPVAAAWDPGAPVASLDPREPSLAEPSELCTTADGGTFATIATFAYYGYACTWLR